MVSNYVREQVNTMAFNNGNVQDIIEHRRELVSQLRIRGLTIREITAALAQPRGDQPPLLNPKTHKPYTHVTIKEDLDAIRKGWQERRAAAADEHADREFAEISEVKRAGWASGNPKLVLEGIDREMKLLGTAKPQEINFNFNIDIVVMLAAAIERRGESPAEWFLAMLQEMADSDDGQEIAEYVNTNADAS